MTRNTLFTDYPSLPSLWVLGSTDIRHIPTYSAVYIITSKDGVVKYVGQTTFLRQRYADHRGGLLGKYDRIGWIKCARDELAFVESWFIATLRPWANENKNKRQRTCSDKVKVTLDVRPSRVWQVGRQAEVTEPARYGHVRGTITSLLIDVIRIDSETYMKKKVRVLLD